MKVFRRSIGLLLPLLLLLSWESLTRLGLLPSSQTAPPSAVALRLIRLLAEGTLLKHLLFSAGRLIAGILIGTFLGTVAGVLLASSRKAEKFFSPTIQFLAGLPVVVWMPFWIVFLGTGETFKIGLASTATFFLVHIHTFQATRVVAARYIELADIYEKSFTNKLRHILLPSVIPSVLTAVRIAVAIGWIVIFFVEYAVSISGSEGLGWFVADARQVGRVEDEFAGMILLGIAGFAIDSFIARLQKRVLMWSDSLDSNIAGPLSE